MGILVRSREKRIAGVCAAIAARRKWNVGLLRTLWVLISIVGVGAPALFYMVLWLVTPSESKRRKSYEERMYERLGKDRPTGQNVR
jgi:phage shock protein PspC (stress-responsive transcriptional regulator)